VFLPLTIVCVRYDHGNECDAWRMFIQCMSRKKAELERYKMMTWDKYFHIADNYNHTTMSLYSFRTEWQRSKTNEERCVWANEITNKSIDRSSLNTIEKLTLSSTDQWASRTIGMCWQ
jgi:hypothetical protein